MTIKKTVTARGLPPVHPGLEQRLREAEQAERKGTTPRQLDGAQKILRPSLDVSSEERAWQARVIGLIDPAYKAGRDGLAPLAEQQPFRPGEDLDDIWDELSEADKIRAGATERFRLELEAALRRAGKGFVPPHKIGGRLDARNLKRSEENIAAELAAFVEVLAPDSYALLVRFVAETRQLLELCHKTRAMLGLDAVAVHELGRDMARKLVYQELASRRRGMGDRGIRRICANVELAERVYAQLPDAPHGTPRDRLMMRIIHVHQDLGHTAYAARTSFRGGRLHRAYGARIFTDEMNRFRTLFAPPELTLVRSSVATHSGEELPFKEARVMALVRAIDHLAPFGPHRVYKHLEGVPHVTDFLDDMLVRARQGEAEKFAAARGALRRFLAEQTDLPVALRDDIIADLRAVDRGAEFVDLGELAGEVAELKLDVQGRGTLVARLTVDPFTRRYQALFDHQQDQLLRLARGCRVSLEGVRPPASLSFGQGGFGELRVEV